jgi:co-chaperonin GroES (HSP10)
MRYQPTQDNVLISVNPSPAEEKTTDSGIILPEVEGSSSSSILRGTVLGVGPGFRNEAGHLIPTSVAPGDEVLVEATAASLVDIEPSRPTNEARLYLIRDYDVRVVFSRK